jgi:hypothetical protein
MIQSFTYSVFQAHFIDSYCYYASFFVFFEICFAFLSFDLAKISFNSCFSIFAGETVS